MVRMFVVGACLLAAGAAQAELTLCNQADVARSVAIAYSDGEAWVSEGWWSVDPGACKIVLAGALKQRNYYYTLTGEEFAGDGYSFCVNTVAFTLPGADGDCPALGAEKRPFGHIDTGTSAKSYSFDLAAVTDTNAAAPASRPATAVPKPDIASATAKVLKAPVPRSSQGDAAKVTKVTDPASHPALAAAGIASFSTGNTGDPFSVTALMQGCGSDEEFTGCIFYAEGWRWTVAQDAANNPAAMEVMAALPINTAIFVTGDLIFYGDITTEAVVAQIELAPPDDFARVRDALQGSWVSQDDPATGFSLNGSEEQETYDGEVIGESLVTFADRCPDGEPAGTVLIKRGFGSDPADTLCLALLKVTANRVELSNVGRGNTLVYLRR